jgi:hypothetical protein
MSVRRSILIACVLLSIPGHIIVGQGRFPATYEKNLSKRFKSFIESQRSGQWERVSELLGDYYSKGRKRIRYSPDQKRRMIEQLCARPMLNPDMTRTGGSVGTDNISLPLNQQYRWIYAFVQFCDGPNCIPIETTLTAYTDKGQWFFTPLDEDFYKLDAIRPTEARATQNPISSAVSVRYVYRN